MRPPLEYGDNFPVPSGGWNPAEPWRFPKHEILPGRSGPLGSALPWITLGLGISLGILWMSWRSDLVAAGKPREELPARPRQVEIFRTPPHSSTRSGLA